MANEHSYHWSCYYNDYNFQLQYGQALLYAHMVLHLRLKYSIFQGLLLV